MFSEKVKRQYREAAEYLSQLPFCSTFLCLWNRKKLQQGVMPEWFTRLVNWCVSD